MGTALLFDREAVDEVCDWEEGLPQLRRSSVLWIDLEHPAESDVPRLADRLGLAEQSVTRLSAVILSGSLLAGIMGMNFRPGLFQQEAYFWGVVATMTVIALTTLIVARTRHWI